MLADPIHVPGTFLTDGLDAGDFIFLTEDGFEREGGQGLAVENLRFDGFVDGQIFMAGIKGSSCD